MKKTFVLAVFALAATGAFAQFNQGRILAGGAVSFNTGSSKSKTPNSTNTLGNATTFFISPDGGYFIMDNLAVGAALTLGVSNSKGEGTNAMTVTSTTASIVPFVRYYLDQGLFFQAQAGGGSRKVKTKQGNQTNDSKEGIFNWGLGVGYAYFLNDFVAIEPLVAYTMNTDNDKDADLKFISSGLSLSIALQVYLGQRQ